MTFMDILYFVFNSIVHILLYSLLAKCRIVLHGCTKHRHLLPHYHTAVQDPGTMLMLPAYQRQVGWLASLTGCHRTKEEGSEPLSLCMPTRSWQDMLEECMLHLVSQQVCYPTCIAEAFCLCLPCTGVKSQNTSARALQPSSPTGTGVRAQAGSLAT